MRSYRHLHNERSLSLIRPHNREERPDWTARGTGNINIPPFLFYSFPFFSFFRENDYAASYELASFAVRDE